MEDAAAIDKCKQGDYEAFAHLVRRYQQQAIGHAVAIVGDRSDAQDAVQDAFIDAYKAIGTFETSRPFYPWFYVLLRNRCFKSTAKKRQTDVLDDVEIVAPVAGLSNAERLDLNAALKTLSNDHREIVTLKYLDDLSYEELAERLQISKGTVMSRLFHARKQLLKRLTRVIDQQNWRGV